MATKIKKNQTANTGKYSYKYVDIAQIHEYLESIDSIYIQKIERIDNDDYIMTKRCFSGQWEEEWIQGCRVVDATLVGVNNPAQQQGSALTYARRYSLLMAYGLATEDDDAQSLSTFEVTEKEAFEYVLGFGKHKGKRLADCDSGYLRWLMYNSKDERIIRMVELVTGEKKMTESEQQEYLELENIKDKLMDETETLPEEVRDYFKLEEHQNYTLEQLKEAVKILEEKRKRLNKGE